MTIYNVHIYREMRLFFPGIEAATAEEAARIAAAKATDEAEYTEDCDGDNLAALIDETGDDDFTQSEIIDFEPERLRKVAPELLVALQRSVAALHDILGAAGNGEAYSPEDLTRLFTEDCDAACAIIDKVVPIEDRLSSTTTTNRRLP